MILKKTVEKFLNVNLNVHGISNKRPAEGSWTEWQSVMRTPQDVRGDGLAIICGKISGYLEVIDIDLKNAIEPDESYNKLKQKINNTNPNIIDSLVIVKTPTGGYHWLYRCPEGIEKSLKLAHRYTTEEERIKNPKELKLILFETRGEGSYICTEPTPGYKVVQGRYGAIPNISAEDRDLILSSARFFEEVIEEAEIPTSSLRRTFNIPNDSTETTTWEAYNRKESVSDILSQAGWTLVRENSIREFWLRPGDSTSESSGNVHKEKNRFTAFSSSTDLIPGKAYNPFGLYTMLMGNGNFPQTTRDLLQKGYGVLSQAKKESVIDYADARSKENEDLKNAEEIDISKYLAHYESDFEYLTSVRDDNVSKGLSTGSKLIDKHFLFKKGTFNTCIGHTSVGKTYSTIFLTMLAALKHDWKIVIIGMENSSASLKRQILELYFQKPLNKTTADEFIDGNEWLDNHYTFIMARGGHIRTISDALSLCYKMYDESHYDMLFLDPYSGFDTEQRNGETSHQANTRLCTAMLNFTTKTNVNLILSVHTVTSSRRDKDANGHLKRPFMDSVEGGSVFSNRADACFIFHRLINHEDKLERLTTQFFVEKDRLLEQGGSLTTIDSPIRLELRDYRFFVGGFQDVIYDIKNEGKIDTKDQRNETIKFGEPMPF
jgi:hypothetical protein